MQQFVYFHLAVAVRKRLGCPDLEVSRAPLPECELVSGACIDGWLPPATLLPPWNLPPLKSRDFNPSAGL